MTAAQEPRAGEVLVWTQRGAGVDGDPLRATATLGDMTAEVLLSRGTGLWNARGSHIDGRLGLATQSEARDYAEVAMRVRAKERVAAARACLNAFVSRPSESSASVGGEALDAAIRSLARSVENFDNGHMWGADPLAVRTVLASFRTQAPAREGEEIDWKAEWEAVCSERIADREKTQEIINERDKWILELLQERTALSRQHQEGEGHE